MITDPDEIARKLRFIARLTAEEIAGWRWALEMDGREPFDCELAALDKREAALGIKRGKVR